MQYQLHLALHQTWCKLSILSFEKRKKLLLIENCLSSLAENAKGSFLNISHWANQGLNRYLLKIKVSIIFEKCFQSAYFFKVGCTHVTTHPCPYDWFTRPLLRVLQCTRISGALLKPMHFTEAAPLPNFFSQQIFFINFHIKKEIVPQATFLVGSIYLIKVKGTKWVQYATPPPPPYTHGLGFTRFWKVVIFLFFIFGLSRCFEWVCSTHFFQSRCYLPGWYN